LHGALKVVVELLLWAIEEEMNGMRRSTSVQKRKLKTRETIQRCVTRKKENVQRYLTTQISLIVFAIKSFNYNLQL
jgi:hypothetical protein